VGAEEASGAVCWDMACGGEWRRQANASSGLPFVCNVSSDSGSVIETISSEFSSASPLGRRNANQGSRVKRLSNGKRATCTRNTFDTHKKAAADCEDDRDGAYLLCGSPC
jgi:hypothetical protein